MKKVLFATTALVASAGIASADDGVTGGPLSTTITVTGGAEMGVVGGERYTNFGWSDLQILTSVDVRFAMVGTTNGGLEFGATVDLDDIIDMGLMGFDPVDNVNGQFADYSVYIKGVFGSLTVGDTDGALDWALTEVDIGGSIDDSHTWHAGFNGNSGLDGTYDGQIARYDYSFGSFGFAASIEMFDGAAAGFDPVWGVGAKYSGSIGSVDVGVGVGYQTVNILGVSRDVIGASVSASSMGFTGIVNYSSYTNVTVGDTLLPGTWVHPVSSHLGVGIGYEWNNFTIGANYGTYATATAGEADKNGYGLAVNYDLGGGAKILAGYGYSTEADLTTGVLGDTVSGSSYSLGIGMSF